MNPIKMSPCFKQYIWGGNKIKEIYKKNTPLPPVAESWEISAHPDGLSTAIGGDCDGMTIPQLCKKYGKSFYGDSMSENEDFPLLLKILDANDRLSVQVHPDDQYAAIHENGSKGKTEAWYILKAEPGATLVYGFNKSISTNDFRKAIENGSTSDVLNHVECKAGDVFFIPAGTVHAVGKGLLIAEIQQSSNTTYRVFDYNRRDANGNLRELHIEQALAVSDTSSSTGKEKTTGTTELIGKNTVRHLIDSKYFCFDEIRVCEKYESDTNNLLHLLFVAEGELCVNGCKLKAGESALIPASTGKYTTEGNGLLLTYFCRK